MFERIFISEDKDFCDKNNLYDNAPLQGSLPQIYIKSTYNKANGGGVYNFNYFKFAEEFDSFLFNKKEKFEYFNEYDNLTFVETLKGTNFLNRIMEDKTFREFILELKHEGCPTCFMLGKMLDHLSMKFYKHGLLPKFKFFRIDTDNDIPMFGRFNATPTYLYVRKTKDLNNIQFVANIEKNEFLFKINKFSLLKTINKIKYHPNLMLGFYTYQKKEFCKKEFDPDHDVKMFEA